MSDEHWLDLPELHDVGDGHDPVAEQDLHDSPHEPLWHDPVEHGYDPVEHADAPAEIHLTWDAHDPLELDVAAIDHTALADAYGVTGAAFDDVLDRLGLPDALDSHSAAVVLGELGVDAGVQHGDVDALAASIAHGDEVLVHGPAGRLAVTRVDVDAGQVELRDSRGAVSTVELPAFENAWEQASYAMVVAEPVAGPAVVVLSTGPVTVLGLVWPPA